jgi:hypothetical protein
MTIPSWLNVGAVTGIIGSVTGIVALVLSYISARRVRAYKTLDLRLEVRKGYSDLNTLVKQELPSLLARAKNSRTSVLSVRGSGGGFERWKADWTDALTTVQTLAVRLQPGQNYRGNTEHDLELKLVEIHEMKRTATTLQEKYLRELEADDRDRDRIRQEHELRLRPRH